MFWYTLADHCDHSLWIWGMERYHRGKFDDEVMGIFLILHSRRRCRAVELYIGGTVLARRPSPMLIVRGIHFSIDHLNRRVVADTLPATESGIISLYSPLDVKEESSPSGRS